MSKYIHVRCSTCGNWFKTHPKQKCDIENCTIIEQFDAEQKRYRNLRHVYCGVSGGTAAGKTYYLVSLISSLVNPGVELADFLNNVGLKFEFGHGGSKKLFKELQEMANKGKLGGTIVRPKLVAEPFDLLITKGRGGDTTQTILTLFNSSGEIYEKADIGHEPQTPKRHEVKEVNAILYFIDPSQDRGLNKLIANPNPVPRDIEIIESIYDILSANENVTRLSVPLAINISKFDLLHQYIGVHVQQPYITIGDMIREYDYLTDEVSKQLKEFLLKNSTTSNPENISRKFNTVNYFAVAPIGHNEILKNLKLAPKGIFAPFFWVLKQLNIL